MTEPAISGCSWISTAPDPGRPRPNTSRPTGCRRTFEQLLGCRHLFSYDHDGVEIQAYCGMIVCMLILIYTGEKPNRAMEQMVWYYLIGQCGSLLRAWRIREGLPVSSSGLGEQAQAGCRSAADTQ